jgi:hypothetical protein
MDFFADLKRQLEPQLIRRTKSQTAKVFEFDQPIIGVLLVGPV